MLRTRAVNQRSDTCAVSSRYEYRADPNTAELPLRLDEVEALLLNGGKVLSRNEAATQHLLRRVAATLRDHRSRMDALQRDVARIRAEREVRDHPVARALEALAALSEDERRQLLDASYLAEVDKLAKSQEEANLARTAAINESNRVRFTLAGLLSDETIPAAARQKIADVVTGLRGNFS